MVRVYKEKDYYKKQRSFNGENLSAASFLGNPLLKNFGDTSILVGAFNREPVKNALAIIGALAVLYMGFKFAGKFAKIKENLKKI